MKNRTVQLIFQSVYCAFALVGILGGIGFFYNHFYWDFYIYFTNISSYLCFGVMLAELVQTAKRRDDGYVSACPRLKFVSMLGILLTFMVYNIMIAPQRDAAFNQTIGCVMLHMVLPVMFILDWILFYEHGKVKWSYPLISTILPLVYCAFVYIHAAILGFDTSILNNMGRDPLIYPYFFLNPEKVGTWGVVKWIAILLVAFIVTGYLFCGLDRLLRKKQKKEA